MGHPIHKHMSGRAYDAKQAYNKDLSDSARLHYLENDEHDKGMSRYSVEKGPHAKHGNAPHRDASPLNNITYGDKSGPTGYIGEQKADLMKYNPVDDRAGMSRYGADQGDSPAKGLKERVVRRQGKVDAARASFGTDDVDGGFDRKLKRLKKSVAKSEKRGMNMDYDTTDASGEGRSRTSTRSGVSRYGSDHGDSPAKGLGDTLKKIGRTVTRGIGDIGMQAVDMIRPDSGSHASGRRPPGATSYQDKLNQKDQEKAHYQKSRDLAASGKTYGSLSSIFDDDGEGGTPAQTPSKKKRNYIGG